MNKITRLLETNKNTKTEDVDDFFLLTIKLKNVFDKFYKSWTRISFKTEEGIQKYQDVNKNIVKAYNNSENINDAIAKYSSVDNKTGLFGSVNDLVDQVNLDVGKILDKKELPPAKIDDLLDEVGKKITAIETELGKQEQKDNFGFQLVMYHFIYSVRLEVLKKINSTIDGALVDINPQSIESNSLQLGHKRFLQNVISFGNYLEQQQKNSNSSIEGDPNITLTLTLTRCSINNADLLSILSTPDTYSDVSDILYNLRSENIAKYLSGIGKELAETYFSGNNTCKLDSFAYNDCSDTCVNPSKSFWPFGNSNFEVSEKDYIKQFGILNADNFKKYFLPTFMILKSGITGNLIDQIKAFTNKQIKSNVLCHPSDIRQLFRIETFNDDGSEKNIEDLPFFGSIDVEIQLGTNSDGNLVLKIGKDAKNFKPPKSTYIKIRTNEILLEPLSEDFAVYIRDDIQEKIFNSISNVPDYEILSGYHDYEKVKKILFANFFKYMKTGDIISISNFLDTQTNLEKSSISRYLWTEIFGREEIDVNELKDTFGTIFPYYEFIKAKKNIDLADQIKRFFNNLLDFIKNNKDFTDFSNERIAIINQLDESYKEYFQKELNYYFKLYFWKVMNTIDLSNFNFKLEAILNLINKEKYGDALFWNGNTDIIKQKLNIGQAGGSEKIEMIGGAPPEDPLIKEVVNSLRNKLNSLPDSNLKKVMIEYYTTDHLKTHIPQPTELEKLFDLYNTSTNDNDSNYYLLVFLNLGIDEKIRIKFSNISTLQKFTEENIKLGFVSHGNGTQLTKDNFEETMTEYYNELRFKEVDIYLQELPKIDNFEHNNFKGQIGLYQYIIDQIFWQFNNNNNTTTKNTLIDYLLKIEQNQSLPNFNGTILCENRTDEKQKWNSLVILSLISYGLYPSDSSFDTPKTYFTNFWCTQEEQDINFNLKIGLFERIKQEDYKFLEKIPREVLRQTIIEGIKVLQKNTNDNIKSAADAFKELLDNQNDLKYQSFGLRLMKLDYKDRFINLFKLCKETGIINIDRNLNRNIASLEKKEEFKIFFSEGSFKEALAMLTDGNLLNELKEYFKSTLNSAQFNHIKKFIGETINNTNIYGTNAILKLDKLKLFQQIIDKLGITKLETTLLEKFSGKFFNYNLDIAATKFCINNNFFTSDCTLLGDNQSFDKPFIVETQENSIPIPEELNDIYIQFVSLPIFQEAVKNMHDGIINRISENNVEHNLIPEQLTFLKILPKNYVIELFSTGIKHITCLNGIDLENLDDSAYFKLLYCYEKDQNKLIEVFLQYSGRENLLNQINELKDGDFDIDSDLIDILKMASNNDKINFVKGLFKEGIKQSSSIYDECKNKLKNLIQDFTNVNYAIILRVCTGTETMLIKEIVNIFSDIFPSTKTIREKTDILLKNFIENIHTNLSEAINTLENSDNSQIILARFFDDGKIIGELKDIIKNIYDLIGENIRVELDKILDRTSNTETYQNILLNSAMLDTYQRNILVNILKLFSKLGLLPANKNVNKNVNNASTNRNSANNFEYQNAFVIVKLNDAKEDFKIKELQKEYFVYGILPRKPTLQYLKPVPQNYQSNFVVVVPRTEGINCSSLKGKYPEEDFKIFGPDCEMSLCYDKYSNQKIVNINSKELQKIIDLAIQIIKEQWNQINAEILKSNDCLIEIFSQILNKIGLLAVIIQYIARNNTYTIDAYQFYQSKYDQKEDLLKLIEKITGKKRYDLFIFKFGENTAITFDKEYKNTNIKYTFISDPPDQPYNQYTNQSNLMKFNKELLVLFLDKKFDYDDTKSVVPTPMGLNERNIKETTYQNVLYNLKQNFLKFEDGIPLKDNKKYALSLLRPIIDDKDFIKEIVDYSFVNDYIDNQSDEVYEKLIRIIVDKPDADRQKDIDALQFVVELYGQRKNVEEDVNKQIIKAKTKAMINSEKAVRQVTTNQERNRIVVSDNSNFLSGLPLNKINKVYVANENGKFANLPMKEENLSGGAGPEQKPKMYIIKFKKDEKIPDTIEGKQLSQLPENDDKKKIWSLTYDELRKQLLAPLEEGILPQTEEEKEQYRLLIESMKKKEREQFKLKVVESVSGKKDYRIGINELKKQNSPLFSFFEKVKKNKNTRNERKLLEQLKIGNFNNIDDDLLKSIDKTLVVEAINKGLQSKGIEFEFPLPQEDIFINLNLFNNYKKDIPKNLTQEKKQIFKTAFEIYRIVTSKNKDVNINKELSLSSLLSKISNSNLTTISNISDLFERLSDEDKKAISSALLDSLKNLGITIDFEQPWTINYAYMKLETPENKEYLDKIIELYKKLDSEFKYKKPAILDDPDYRRYAQVVYSKSDNIQDLKIKRESGWIFGKVDRNVTFSLLDMEDIPEQSLIIFVPFDQSEEIQFTDANILKGIEKPEESYLPYPYKTGLTETEYSIEYIETILKLKEIIEGSIITKEFLEKLYQIRHQMPSNYNEYFENKFKGIYFQGCKIKIAEQLDETSLGIPYISFFSLSKETYFVYNTKFPSSLGIEGNSQRGGNCADVDLQEYNMYIIFTLEKNPNLIDCPAELNEKVIAETTFEEVLKKLCEKLESLSLGDLTTELKKYPEPIKDFFKIRGNNNIGRERTYPTNSISSTGGPAERRIGTTKRTTYNVPVKSNVLTSSSPILKRPESFNERKKGNSSSIGPVGPSESVRTANAVGVESGVVVATKNSVGQEEQEHSKKNTTSVAAEGAPQLPGTASPNSGISTSSVDGASGTAESVLLNSQKIRGSEVPKKKSNNSNSLKKELYATEINKFFQKYESGQDNTLKNFSNEKLQQKIIKLAEDLRYQDVIKNNEYKEKLKEILKKALPSHSILRRLLTNKPFGSNNVGQDIRKKNIINLINSFNKQDIDINFQKACLILMHKGKLAQGTFSKQALKTAPNTFALLKTLKELINGENNSYEDLTFEGTEIRIQQGELTSNEDKLVFKASGLGDLFTLMERSVQAGGADEYCKNSDGYTIYVIVNHTEKSNVPEMLKTLKIVETKYEEVLTAFCLERIQTAEDIVTLKNFGQSNIEEIKSAAIEKIKGLIPKIEDTSLLVPLRKIDFLKDAVNERLYKIALGLGNSTEAQTILSQLPNYQQAKNLIEERRKQRVEKAKKAKEQVNLDAHRESVQRGQKAAAERKRQKEEAEKLGQEEVPAANPKKAKKAKKEKKEEKKQRTQGKKVNENNVILNEAIKKAKKEKKEIIQKATSEQNIKKFLTNYNKDIVNEAISKQKELERARLAEEARQKEEEERERLAEEARQKEEEERERKRKDEARQRQKEEEERRRQEEAAAKAKAEAEERQKEEEEARQRQKEEEARQRQKELERKQKEEAERKQKEAAEKARKLKEIGKATLDNITTYLENTNKSIKENAQQKAIGLIALPNIYKIDKICKIFKILKSQKVKGINPGPIKELILRKVRSELSELKPTEENINIEINNIFKGHGDCWPTEPHERLNDTYYIALQSVIYPRNINVIKKSLIRGEVENKNILVKKILEELLRLKPDNEFLQEIVPGPTNHTNVRESIPSSSDCQLSMRDQTKEKVKELISKIDDVGYRTLFNRLIDLSTTFKSQNKEAINTYVTNLVTMLRSEDGPKTKNGEKYFEILRQITIANLWHIEDKDLLAKNNNREKNKTDKDFVLTKLKELREVASNKFNCFAWNQAIPQTIASDAVRRLSKQTPPGQLFGGASSDISVNQLIKEIRSHGELKERFEASVNKFKNNGIKQIAREILEDKYKNNKQNKISELHEGYEKNILTLITAWKTAYYKQKLLNCAENIGKPNSCPTDYKELEEIFRSQYILNSIDKDNLIGCILKRVKCMKEKVNAGNLYRDILVNFEELLKSLQSNSNKNTQEELFIKTSNYLYTCINTTKNTNKFQELQIYLMILKEKIFPKLTINAKAFDEKNCKKTN